MTIQKLSDILPDLSETLNELYKSDSEPYDITLSIMKRITAIESRLANIEKVLCE